MLSISFAFIPQERTNPLLIQQAQFMEIGGYPGDMINKCIDKRIIGQDIDHLI